MIQPTQRQVITFPTTGEVGIIDAKVIIWLRVN